MDSLLILGATGVIFTLGWILFCKKVADNIFWGVLALVFFLPFERIPSLDVAGFTLKINHIVSITTLLWWAYDHHHNNRVKRGNPLSLPLWLVIISQAITLPLSLNPIRSYAFFALNILMTMICGLIYDQTINVDRIKKVEKVIIVSTCLVVLFALFQFTGDMVGLPLWLTGLAEGYSKITFGFPRVQAFSREPLYLGNFLLIPIGILIASWLEDGKINLKKLLLGVLLIIVFILTISRGAYLGLIAMGLITICLAPKRFFNLKTIISVMSVGLVSLLIIAAILAGLGSTSRDKFLGHIIVTDYGTSESTAGRLNAFGQAIEYWKSSPFIGIGLGNYGAYTTNGDPDKPAAQNIVNNEYIEILTETGMIGLGAFIILLGVVFARVARALIISYRNVSQNIIYLRGLTIGLCAALVGILVQYNFFSTLAIFHIWVLIGLLVAVSQTLIDNSFSS